MSPVLTDKANSPNMESSKANSDNESENIEKTKVISDHDLEDESKPTFSPVQIPKSNALRDNCPDGISDADKDMLANCIKASLPSPKIVDDVYNRLHDSQTGNVSIKLQPCNHSYLPNTTSESNKKHSLFRLPQPYGPAHCSSTSISRTSFVDVDSVCIYRTEDTPILSPSASISDLSSLSFNESFLNNSRNSDCRDDMPSPKIVDDVYNRLHNSQTGNVSIKLQSCNHSYLPNTTSESNKKLSLFRLPPPQPNVPVHSSSTSISRRSFIDMDSVRIYETEDTPILSPSASISDLSSLSLNKSFLNNSRNSDCRDGMASPKIVNDVYNRLHNSETGNVSIKLQSCNHSYLPNTTSESNKKLSLFRLPQPYAPVHSSSISISRTSFRDMDSMRIYRTEDTPILSPSASISDLSSLSFNESFLNNSHNSDCRDSMPSPKIVDDVYNRLHNSQTRNVSIKLQSCSRSYLPNTTSESNKELSLFRLPPPQPNAPVHSSSTSISRTSFINVDSMRIYRTEDTPILSPSASTSDLSSLSLNKSFLNDSHNSDCRAGMPSPKIVDDVYNRLHNSQTGNVSIKLQSCSRSYLPNTTSESNKKLSLSRLPPPEPSAPVHSSATSISRKSFIDMDSMHVYRTEDTPILSPSASISDISSLSLNKSFLSNSRNSDCSSESDDDELLLQCIRSGMPEDNRTVA